MLYTQEENFYTNVDRYAEYISNHIQNYKEDFIPSDVLKFYEEIYSNNNITSSIRMASSHRYNSGYKSSFLDNEKLEIKEKTEMTVITEKTEITKKIEKNRNTKKNQQNFFINIRKLNFFFYFYWALSFSEDNKNFNNSIDSFELINIIIIDLFYIEFILWYLGVYWDIYSQ